MTFIDKWESASAGLAPAPDAAQATIESTKTPCWGVSTIWPPEPKVCALSLVASQAETTWRFRQAAWPPLPAKPLQPAPPLPRQMKWKHGFTGLPGTFLSHGPHEAMAASKAFHSSFI